MSGISRNVCTNVEGGVYLPNSRADTSFKFPDVFTIHKWMIWVPVTVE